MNEVYNFLEDKDAASFWKLRDIPPKTLFALIFHNVRLLESITH